MKHDVNKGNSIDEVLYTVRLYDGVNLIFKLGLWFIEF
jgi:hypothetical protein